MLPKARFCSVFLFFSFSSFHLFLHGAPLRPVLFLSFERAPLTFFLRLRAPLSLLGSAPITRRFVPFAGVPWPPGSRASPRPPSPTVGAFQGSCYLLAPVQGGSPPARTTLYPTFDLGCAPFSSLPRSLPRIDLQLASFPTRAELCLPVPGAIARDHCCRALLSILTGCIHGPQTSHTGLLSRLTIRVPPR